MKKLIVLIATVLFSISYASAQEWGDTIQLIYKLHGQTRRFNTVFTRLHDGGAKVSWDIERNLKIWRGSYTMSPKGIESGTYLSFLMPEDGNHIKLPENETFAILPYKAFKELKQVGSTMWNGTTFRLDSIGSKEIFATDINEGARITVLNNPEFPLITSMQENPLEINWTSALISPRSSKRKK